MGNDSALRYASPHDCALLTLIAHGDAEAMASLYDKYSRIVYSIALRVCRDSGAAEDIVQEVFMQIWRRPQQISTQGSLAGWLAVVSRNRSIDFIRKRRSMDCVDDLMLPSAYDPSGDAALHLMIGKARALMSDLPPVQRQVLEMAFFGGKTHAEIANEMGCPLGTIKTRIRSALSSLRKGLEVSPTTSPLIVPNSEVVLRTLHI